MDNVWLLSGGSGHGYKHGIMVGDYAARRVTGQTTDPVLDETFKLKDETFYGLWALGSEMRAGGRCLAATPCNDYGARSPQTAGFRTRG